MFKKTTLFLLVVAILLTACQPAATPTEAPEVEEPTQPIEVEEPEEEPTQPAEEVTLRVLIHQHPPLVEYMETFNEQFEAAYPNVTVDMSVVIHSDLPTVSQTRLTANDVDVLDANMFSNAAQPYMVDVVPPNWQTLIEAGLLMDLSGQPFLDYYYPDALADAGTFDGKVYQINLGRVGYSGVFYNKDLFAEYGLEVPTTWDDLVVICETFTAADIPCMTAGGADSWPIFVGAFGLLGAMYPDQAALVEGLWTGEIKWNDPKSIEMWEKMQVYARDMLEPGSSGIGHDAAPGRFASGAVAMLPMGTWNGAMIDDAGPDFEWGYFPFPGSDDPAENQYMFGKYDMGWTIAANTPYKEEALNYLAMFSEPENYQAFIDAVEFIPTQPNITLDSNLGRELAPYLDKFRVGHEQYWVAPTGTGQYALPWASYFQPFGEWDDPVALANQAQADMDAGLEAVGLKE
jgi:raffinose/stachyose/melibiose transport system substrate-binding protein